MMRRVAKYLPPGVESPAGHHDMIVNGPVIYGCYHYLSYGQELLYADIC